MSSKSVKRLQRYGGLTSFSKWRPSAILDLLGAYWDHPRRPLCGLYRRAKFGWNRCSCFDNIKLSIFCPFGLKTPIHAPKIGVFGGFTAKMGSNINETPKRNSLVRVPIVWVIKRENPSVGEFMKKGINKKFVIFYPFAHKPSIDGFEPNLAQPQQPPT